MTYKKDDLLKLQSVEKEMLAEVDRVCHELGIQYFSVGGTTLGAIRHNGFIPWDDDIDIGMMRNDYELFLKNAPLLLDKKYFLQNFIFNKHTPQYHTKVMKKGTTFVEKGIEHLKIQKGIFLDVMPYDYLPENDRKQAKVLKKQMFFYSLFGLKSQIRTFSRGKVANLLLTVVRFFLWILLLPFPKALFFNLYDSSLKNASGKSPVIGTRGYANCIIYEDELFPLRPHQFNETEIPVPNNCDAVLKRQYGDYMTLPPPNKRHQHSPVVLSFGDDDAKK